MNLEELIAAINAFANPDELAEAMKTKAKRVYQVVFNEGHGVATAQAVNQETKLKNEVKVANDAKVAAENALKEFKSTSNVEELRATYDKRIADKDKEIQSLKDDMVSKDRNGQVSGVRSKVLSGLKALVDDDKSDALVEAPKTASRIKFDEATNRVQIYQSNGVPFPGTEDEQAAALVEELKAGVPDVLLKSSVAAGTGRSSTTPIGAGNGGGKKKGKEFFDSIRESVQKPAPGAGNPEYVPPEQQLNKRLGLRGR